MKKKDSQFLLDCLREFFDSFDVTETYLAGKDEDIKMRDRIVKIAKDNNLKW